MELVNCRSDGIELPSNGVTGTKVLLMAKKNAKLLAFINAMTTQEQFHFAERCETTAAHIRNVAHGYSTCSEKLAINLERETEREVKCESLRDDVDWNFIRNTPRRGANKKD